MVDRTLSGKGAKVTIITGDGYELIGEGVSYSITTHIEQIDVTSFGDPRVTFIPGMVTYEANFKFTSLDVVGDGENTPVSELNQIDTERLLRRLDNGK